MKNKKKVKKVPRNPFAMDAKSRKSGGPMKDRREPRGGAVNEQDVLKQEYLDDTPDEEDEFDI